MSETIDPSETDVPDEVPGTVLAGKFRILSTLGSDGMSTVFKVRQLMLNQDMALKLVDQSKVLDSVRLRRFQQEAKAVFSLSHPSLIKVYDFGVLEDGRPYMAMELVEGESLAQYLNRNGTIPLDQIVPLFAQLCFGLAYAHERHIIHRDIKPGNIMLAGGKAWTEEGSAKIVDFGIAKMVAESDEHQALTREGEVFGSPMYMSPEQCSGAAIDHRTDIYSLGCVLFEALTGTVPFVSDSALHTLILHRDAEVPTLKEATLGREFPEALERIVAKMLAKSPANRYSDLAAIPHELMAVLPNTWGTFMQPADKPAAKVVSTKASPQTVTLSRSQLVTILFAAASAGSLITWSSLFFTSNRSNPNSEPHRVKELRISQPDWPSDKQLDEAKTFAAVSLPPFSETIVDVNGQKRRQLHFPRASVGEVSDMWLGDGKRPGFVMKPAAGVVEFPADRELSLGINLIKLPDLGSAYDFYKTIPAGEFEALELNDGGIDKVVPTPPKLLFVDEMIKMTATWTKLRRLILSNIILTPGQSEALSECRSLTTIVLNDVMIPESGNAFRDFISRMQTVTLKRVDTDKIIESLRGSTALRTIVLYHTRLSVNDVQTLQTCKHLNALILRAFDEPIDKTVIEQIRRIETLTEFAYTTPHEKQVSWHVSADGVRELLKMPHLKHVILTKSDYDEIRKSGIRDVRVVDEYHCPARLMNLLN